MVFAALSVSERGHFAPVSHHRAQRRGQKWKEPLRN